MDHPRAGAHYPRSAGEFQAWFGTGADCAEGGGFQLVPPLQGDSIDALLTIVFASLAVSRRTRARPVGRSGICAIARRDRTIEARAARQVVAVGLLPGGLRRAVDATGRPGWLAC